MMPCSRDHRNMRTVGIACVDNFLRLAVCEMRLPPLFDLLGHRLQVALHLVHADCESVLEVEMLRVLGKDRCEVAGECHVVAHEDPDPDDEAKMHGFVVGILEPEREAVPHPLCSLRQAFQR